MQRRKKSPSLGEREGKVSFFASQRKRKLVPILTSRKGVSKERRERPTFPSLGVK